MSRRDSLCRLRDHAPAVLPSMLLCDFGRLGEEVQRLEQAGVAGLHLDVMDGHFVPNLTYGLPLVRAFRRLTDLPLDVHLMIANPGAFLRDYVEAGADLLTVHAEAVDEPAALLESIRDLGVGAGLAVNPDTPIVAIEDCLPLCDLVLVMSVMPGFGGQAFRPEALDKLRDVESRPHDDVLLAVDGGVNASTIGDCAEAGAELFVVGSAIFNGKDYAASIRELHELTRHRAVR